jgi:ABC-2 type transport system ATP-binding protein/lipopolysaccharide transport system ATP-binding protein
MWLEHGQIRGLGPAIEVADAYIGDVNEREVQTHQVSSVEAAVASESKRIGSGEVRITSIEFLDVDGKSSPVLLAGSPCAIRMHYSAHEDISHAVFGLGFLHESGVNVSGPNSGRHGSWSLKSGDGYVDFVVEELLLQPGTYEVSTAIVDRGHMFDYADREFDLRVRGRGDQEPGLTRMPGIWNDPVTLAAGAQVATLPQENARAQ